MIRTLIVDDETLVRATLRTLVDWEALGYTIVQDCSDRHWNTSKEILSM